jgi:quercetin dioxygenase-like cupin family protein
MAEIFPEPILSLPKADIPIDGLIAYLAQGVNHQILFMEFEEDVEIPEHFHEAQWGIILKGKIDLTINGLTQTFQKGDTYFISKNVKHSAKIYAGYSDVTFFNQKDRYQIK